MKASCVPILGILGHVIVNWDAKNIKNGDFWLEKLLIRLQKPLGVESWNLNTMWVLMNISWKTSLGALGHLTKFLQAENGQKVDEFEPIYLGNYPYWWKMVCNFWAHYQPPFCWLCSFTLTNLNTIFLVLHLFCYFFLSFFVFSYRYLLLNR